jgi:hypothetical protein
MTQMVERRAESRFLPYLGGGAKLTLHLTDVTPKLGILLTWP